MILLLTLLFGFTVFLGTSLILFIKNDKTLKEVSISMAFSVLLFLVFLELIPESLEHLDYISFLLFVICGIAILKVLDLFIPHHTHSTSKNHISHIGLMACVALLLHNLIEGMALYTSLSSDIHMGLLMGIGVGLHNIPMGMIIGSTLKDAKFSNLKVLLISALVSISTFLGSFIVSLFTINEYIMGILLSITLGMIIYIIFFELLEHMHHQNKKNNLIGFLFGALIFIISLLFHTH